MTVDADIAAMRRVIATTRRRLAAALKISPVVARLLCQRGLGDPELADRFLNPSLDHLHDPMVLADMGVAVDRILRAIARKERIAIHGDYDVDGVTSTVILRRALELLGADVVHFIPERLKDGYGLQPVAIERLHADGVALIISVDCGIRGAEAARRARELGVDLIITDHHEPDAELPPALAVINPKRRDCTLSGQVPRRRRRRAEAGAGALPPRRPRQAGCPGFIKVAAIGTLADVVPLVGENRVIAKIGLELLTQGPAQGRTARAARRLRPDRQDHRQLSHRLHAGAARQRRRPHEHARHRHAPVARRRRGAGRGGARSWRCSSTARTSGARKKKPRSSPQAKKIVTTDPDVGARSILVVAGEGWHRGVIGIVASKLVDAFHRPAIVLSIEDGIAHGSCRSISRFDMLGALERCAHLLTRFGGHKQAAGLTLDAGRDPRAARGGQRRRRRDARSRRPDAAAAHRRRPAFREHHRRRRGRDRGAGAVRRRQPAAGVRRARRRDHRWSAQAEGAAPEDVAQAGRPDLPRRSPGARPSGTTSSTEHKAALDVAFSLEQNQYNGNTYVELTLADLKRCEDVRA